MYGVLEAGKVNIYLLLGVGVWLFLGAIGVYHQARKCGLKVGDVAIALVLCLLGPIQMMMAFEEEYADVWIIKPEKKNDNTD